MFLLFTFLSSYYLTIFYNYLNMFFTQLPVTLHNRVRSINFQSFCINVSSKLLCCVLCIFYNSIFCIFIPVQEYTFENVF